MPPRVGAPFDHLTVRDADDEIDEAARRLHPSVIREAPTPEAQYGG
jgi:hypothetical protein